MDDFNTHSLLQRQEKEGKEVNREISTITGVNIVRSRRVNGPYIQDIDNLLNVFKVIFAYLQKKETASQKGMATPENPGLGSMTLCIHHQLDEAIVLLFGFNIPYALQRSLRKSKRALEWRGYVQLDSY